MPVLITYSLLRLRSPFVAILSHNAPKCSHHWHSILFNIAAACSRLGNALKQNGDRELLLRLHIEARHKRDERRDGKDIQLQASFRRLSLLTMNSSKKASVACSRHLHYSVATLTLKIFILISEMPLRWMHTDVSSPAFYMSTGFPLSPTSRIVSVEDRR